MQEVTQMVASLGFPIVVALGMFWFYSKMVEMLNTHYTSLMSMFSTMLDKMENLMAQLLEVQGNAKGD